MMPWDNAEELSELWEQYPTVSRLLSHINAQGFMLSKRTLMRRLKKFGIYESKSIQNKRVLERYASRYPRYDTFMKLSGDFAVCSDTHVPRFSIDFLDKFLGISKDAGLKNCIIIGDFFDASSVSSFDNEDKAHLLEHELEIGEEIFKEMFAVFDDIYIVTGNHDERIPRFFDHQISLERIFSGCCDYIHKTNFHFSTHHFCTVNDSWRLTHPKNYSKIPGRIPYELAEIKHQNVICGHTHTISYCWSKSGHYQCAECGGLFDSQKMAYKQTVDSTYPEWQNGFGTLIDNRLRLYDKSDF